MKSSPRFLFLNLVVFAALLLGSLLFALSRWSDGTHWLMWCLTTLMHLQLAVWHTTGMLLALLFAFTVLKMGLFLAVSFLRIYRRSAQLKPTAIPQKLALLLKKENIDAANIIFIRSSGQELYCFGWLRPKIVVARSILQLLSPSELQVALRHEEYHRRHRHALKLWLAELISQALWFIPLAADVVAYLRYRTEASADIFAANGRDDRQLLTALQKFMTVPRWQTAFATSPAEERIKAIRSQTPSSFRPRNLRIVESLSVLIIFVAAFVLVAAPTQANGVQTLLNAAMTEHNNHCPQPQLFSPVDGERR